MVSRYSGANFNLFYMRTFSIFYHLNQFLNSPEHGFRRSLHKINLNLHQNNGKTYFLIYLAGAAGPKMNTWFRLSLENCKLKNYTGINDLQILF